VEIFSQSIKLKLQKEISKCNKLLVFCKNNPNSIALSECGAFPIGLWEKSKSFISFEFYNALKIKTAPFHPILFQCK